MNHSSPTRPLTWWLTVILGGLAIALLVTVCYARVPWQQFVMWDDPGYVAERRIVHEGLTSHSVAWAWSTFAEANWHPLTWLSHMLDVELWGLRAGPMKLTNVVIHSINTLLLLAFLVGATGSRRRSLIVAALFALHPLRVESVAWVSERKDVLSACFGLLALCAYVFFARAPSAKRMAIVALCYALSLLAKPTLVTLPCLLLVLDFWPLRRWRPDADARPASATLPVVATDGDASDAERPRFAGASPKTLVVEKIPLLVLTGVSSVVTYLAQARGGAVNTFEQVGFVSRIGNAIDAYARYLHMTVWPADLSFFYPHPLHPKAMPVALAAVALVAITAAVIFLRKKTPAVLAGWLWYLGTLVPMIGLVQVGGQSMADRYTYIPTIGLLILIVWLLPSRWFSRVPAAIAAGLVVVSVVAALAWQTTRQVRVWDDNYSLFLHAIEVNEANYLARLNLGGVYILEKKYDLAIAQFDAGLKVRPTFAMLYHAYGRALADKGRTDEAIAMYRKALIYRPDYGDVLCNSAPVLEKAGFKEEALRNLQQAVRVDPENATFQRALGMAYASRGATAQAIPPLKKSAELDPTNAGTFANLGVALHQVGQTKDAAPYLKQAVRLNPQDTSSRENLAAVLVGTGDFAGAAEQLEVILKQTKDSAELRSNLAFVLSRAGRVGEAIEHLHKAIALAPADASLHNELGRLLARNGRIDEAVSSFEEAVKLAPANSDYKADLAKAKAMKS